MIELTRSPIDYHSLTESVRDDAAGAVVLFLGTVREFTRGVQTDWLEYEAYPEMATASMAQLEAEVRQNFPVIHVAISHRIGSLQLGDVSVAVAVSTPHRAQAFEAGKWLIDVLKERVPIWKKEHFSDGRQEWQHPGMMPRRDGMIAEAKETAEAVEITETTELKDVTEVRKEGNVP